MARRESGTLTEVELEFMRVLWDRGEATSEEVLQALGADGRPLADGTVRKMLGILLRKGYLSRRREGRAFIYRPRVDERNARRDMARDLLRRAFEGKASLLVASLVDGRSLRKGELDAIRRLLDAQEKGGTR